MVRKCFMLSDYCIENQHADHDSTGRILKDLDLINQRVTQYFSEQFSDGVNCIPYFAGHPSPLYSPISGAEMYKACMRMNNRHACEPGGIPAELLKYGAEVLSVPLADIMNSSECNRDPVSIGRGIFILLQKLGEPLGPLSSLRPIVLLGAVWKAISLMVLAPVSYTHLTLPTNREV